MPNPKPEYDPHSEFVPDDDELYEDEDYDDYEDEDYYEEDEEDWDECGRLPPHLGGGCQLAGTEHCDFECPFRDEDDEDE